MAGPALFHSPPVDEIVNALLHRLRARVREMVSPALADLVADTVFFERKRTEHDGADEAYAAALDAAAQSLRTVHRGAMEQALDQIVACYAREIHNPFSPRAYKLATRAMPGVLTRLLSATRPRDLILGEFDPATRIRIGGQLDQIRHLTEKGTVIVAPTHVSNLDSPLIGYALYAAGLPPCAYGAGLNLFSTPVMAWWMRRLGAYTVDRRKRNRLYKETLKDYSVEILRRRQHQIFFPGGTRSRSGRLETKLKKGLLGTGLAAWQENLRDHRADGEVWIVPCTLSMGLVLEAETLIADSLAEEGKQRYIIHDDEFSEPRTVASFTRQILSMDAGVHAVFGAPMDIAGNPVDAEGRSLDPHGKLVDRRGYVCDRAGDVVVDEQRDHLYTERVAEQLSEAYKHDFVVQSTHLAAWAAWEALKRAYPGYDTYRLVRLLPDQRVVERVIVERLIEEAQIKLGRQPRACPQSARAIVDEAIQRFATFHRVRALAAVGPTLRLGGELTLYYRNRLVGLLG